MEELFKYLLQSSGTLIIFYSVYAFLFRKETWFVWNRWYLLFSIITAFSIPIIGIPSFNESPESLYTINLQPISIYTNAETSFKFTLSDGLAIIYLIGVSLTLIRFFARLFAIYKIRSQSESVSIDGIRFMLTDNLQTFSFMNTIYINKQLMNDKLSKQIIDHELTHVRQHHSFDIILMEISSALLWFNPIIWMCKSSLKTIHEFLADEAVLQRGVSVENYHKLIFSQVTGFDISGEITNTFSSYKLKNRIIMMTKEKTERKAKIKMLAVIPAFLIALFLISGINNISLAQDVKNITKKKASEVKSSADKQQKTEEPVFMVVEKAPEFPGGTKAQIKFIADNIKYPEKAKKAGLEGNVYISFIVKKDGSISDAKIARGFDKECDAEALRVVKMMPKWKPGQQRGKNVNVQFILPIRFAISGEENK